MELIQISKAMQKELSILQEARMRLKQAGNDKAHAIAHYEKELSIVILKLKSGKELELDGNKIINPPVTIVEKIARGICWKDKLAVEGAEAKYKNIIASMESSKTIINAYQSLNKYQKEIEEQ